MAGIGLSSLIDPIPELRAVPSHLSQYEEYMVRQVQHIRSVYHQRVVQCVEQLNELFFTTMKEDELLRAMLDDSASAAHIQDRILELVQAALESEQESQVERLTKELSLRQTEIEELQREGQGSRGRNVVHELEKKLDKANSELSHFDEIVPQLRKREQQLTEAVRKLRGQKTELKTALTQAKSALAKSADRNRELKTALMKKPTTAEDKALLEKRVPSVRFAAVSDSDSSDAEDDDRPAHLQGRAKGSYKGKGYGGSPEDLIQTQAELDQLRLNYHRDLDAVRSALETDCERKLEKLETELADASERLRHVVTVEEHEAVVKRKDLLLKEKLAEVEERKQNEFQLTLANIRQGVKTLENSLSEEQRLRKQAEEALEKLKSQNSNLSEEHDSHVKEFRTLRERIAHLEKQNMQFLPHLDEASTHLESLKKKYVEEQAKRKNADKVTERVRTEMAKLETQLEESCLQRNLLEQKLKSSSYDELQAAQGRIRQLEDESSKREDAIEKLNLLMQANDPSLRLTALQQQVDALSHEKMVLEEQLQQYQSAHVYHQQNEHTLRRRLQGLRHELSRLRSSVDQDMRSMHGFMKRMVELMSGRCHTILDDQQKQHMFQVRLLEQRAENPSKEQLREIFEQQRDQNTVVENMRGELASAQKENSQLRSEVRNKELVLKDLLISLEAHFKLPQVLMNSITYGTNTDSVHANVRELKAAIRKRLTRNQEDLEMKLKETESELQDTKARFEALKAEYKSSAEKQKKAVEELQHVHREWQTSQETVNQMENDHREELTNLKSTLSRLSSVEKNEAVSALKGELLQLNSFVSTLQKRYRSDLTSKSEDYDKQVKSLQRKLKEQQELLLKQSKRLATVSPDVSRVDAEVKELQASKREVESRAQSLDQERRRLEQLVHSLQSQRDSAYKELESRKEEMFSMTKRNQETLSNEGVLLNDLRKRLEEKEDRLKTEERSKALLMEKLSSKDKEISELRTTIDKSYSQAAVEAMRTASRLGEETERIAARLSSTRTSLGGGRKSTGGTPLRQMPASSQATPNRRVQLGLSVRELQ